MNFPILETITLVVIVCNYNTVVCEVFEHNVLLTIGNRHEHLPIYSPAIQQPPTTFLPTVLGSNTYKPKEILPSANIKCLQPRGQFPSDACNRFVNCWNGIGVEQNCPDQLVFNGAKGYCDYAENVNCNGKPIAENSLGSVSDATSSSQAQSSTNSISPSVMNPTTSSSAIVPTPSTVYPSLKKNCLKPRGQFPSNSCNKYVNCWDDIVREEECAEGLMFSSKGYCDYPHNVDCTKRLPIKLETNSNRECPVDYGTFRHKNNCSNYFVCAANKVVAKYECPNGLSFNDNIGVCDYSYRVDCTKEPLIFQKRSVEDLTYTNTKCSTEFGTFRDENNCSFYYTCAYNKVAAQYQCPPGLFFNENIGVCDFEYRVNCSQKPTTFQYTNTFVPQIPPDFMDKIDGCTPGLVFRLNSECTIACLCREGLAEIIQCPVGLAYDSPTDKCLTPDLARC